MSCPLLLNNFRSENKNLRPLRQRSSSTEVRFPRCCKYFSERAMGLNFFPPSFYRYSDLTVLYGVLKYYMCKKNANQSNTTPLEGRFSSFYITFSHLGTIPSISPISLAKSFPPPELSFCLGCHKLHGRLRLCYLSKNYC